jgi:serine protease Do
MKATNMSVVRSWAHRAVPGLAALSLLTAALVQPAPALAQAAPTVQLPDFSELVERVGPAVVNIRTTERRVAQGSGGAEMDPGVEEFFRRFGIPLPRRGNPGTGGG